MSFTPISSAFNLIKGDLKTSIFSTAAALFLLSSNGFSQCADSANIYTFGFNGHSYEVVKETKTATDAAICAVSRGGYLAEINDLAEQNEIFMQLTANAGINIANTQNQFGTASVWLGGTDAVTEGDWIWDGDHDGTGPQFWSGGPSGMAIGGLYTNWGTSPAEPDNSGGQDYLTIIIKPTAVNFGLWNDLISTNAIYYLIEYNSALAIDEKVLQSNVSIYPNPMENVLTIDNSNDIEIDQVVIYDVTGKQLITADINEAKQNSIDVSSLENGIYMMKVFFENGDFISKTIVK